MFGSCCWRHRGDVSNRASSLTGSPASTFFPVRAFVSRFADVCLLGHPHALVIAEISMQATKDNILKFSFCKLILFWCWLILKCILQEKLVPSFLGYPPFWFAAGMRLKSANWLIPFHWKATSFSCKNVHNWSKFMKEELLSSDLWPNVESTFLFCNVFPKGCCDLRLSDFSSDKMSSSP